MPPPRGNGGEPRTTLRGRCRADITLQTAWTVPPLTRVVLCRATCHWPVRVAKMWSVCAGTGVGTGQGQ